MNPNFPDAFVVSAMAKQAKGDAAGAVADVTRAISLDARNSRLYLNRANIELEQGDMKKASDDYDKAVDLSPTDPEFRASRGYFRYDQHLWADALADFKFAFDNAPPPHDDYVRFRICLIGMYTGDKAAAAKAMHDYLATRKPPKKPDDWASRVGAFLAGDITEPQFIKSADHSIKKTDAEQHCEAYYYAGAKALANGEKDVAKTEFQKCIATGITYFTEYRSAKAELKLMGVKP
jgi:lipoprotein NlpI